MRLRHVVSVVVALTVGCSALGQKGAQKPVDTHYSAAFIDGSRLYVFPFDGSRVALDLPINLGGMTFSANGRNIYGVARLSGSAKPSLVAVTIKPSGISRLPGSDGFSFVNSLAVDGAGDKAAISATYEREGIRECGIFELGLITGKIEKVVDSIGGGCDFLSSWTQLSLSPDGSRVVGSAQKGQLGLINLKQHRIERLWSGTAAFWSPNGKWIAALDISVPTQIELIGASDFSKRSLGIEDGATGRLEWSPDSRYLLLWTPDFWCGLGTGYSGTLRVLDIETGQRSPINSSKCGVNLMTTGWVSDDVLN